VSCRIQPWSISDSPRSNYPEGIFRISSGSGEKTVVFSDRYLQELSKLPNKSKDSQAAQIQFISRGFGVASNLPTTLEKILPQVHETLAEACGDASMSLPDNVVRKLEQKMPQLLSFLDNPIDHEPWERMSGTSLLDDEETMETGLM
jgi:hypothetical protein